MDPWLEDEEFFRDIHGSLIFLLREAINAILPPGYVARGTQLVWVDDDLRREPDVGVFGADRLKGAPTTAPSPLAGVLAVADDPVLEPWEQPYLEIRTGQGKRLVTTIEVVSRSNKKAGDNGRTAYKQKQVECRLSGVNLVEIDLLRAGPHTTAVPEDHLRRVAGPFDYHVSVMVAGTPNRYYAAPARLEEPLPPTPIPLDPGVPAVTVALQPLLDRAYDSGRYASEIDYRRPCSPPLTPDQQAWAEGVLKAKGLLP
jgi:hypothetical protein